MKLLVSLNNKSIDDYLNYTNSFIIGLKDFSINYLEYSIDEIELLRKNYPNIEIFVSINKNIFNEDLLILEDNLIKLNNIGINGVLFYDLSILSITKRLSLNLPLIWNQEHMTTNYNTCNYYYDKGCEYAYLSSEITCDEIKGIRNNSKIKLISLIFGYPPVSFSKRKLLSNYFLYNNKSNNKEYYEISSDNQNKYFIKENKLGTSILYGNILNGVKPFYELKDYVDYFVLDENMINHDLFIQVLNVFSKLADSKINYQTGENEIYHLCGSRDTVFYYKKTIYKVKNEKKN